MAKRITVFVKRASFLCLVGGGFLLLAGCGGRGSSDTFTAPTPAPPPAPPAAPTPVTNVIGGGNASIPVNIVLVVNFITTATGTIGVTVDWTFATNDVDVALARGTDPCTLEQLNNDTCPFLGFSASTTAKPDTLSVPNLEDESYTLYIPNSGPTDESVGFQITLTSVPAAAAVSTPSTSFGGSKGSLSGRIIMPR